MKSSLKRQRLPLASAVDAEGEHPIGPFGGGGHGKVLEHPPTTEETYEVKL